MLLQLEREFLQADLVTVRRLLQDAPPDEDPIEHFQFAQRARQLEERLAALPGALLAAPAAVALFFGGRPVHGSHGIKANFGTKAVGHFQKLVSLCVAAGEHGPLSARGRVPLSDDSQLLVTDVVRGSFGFVLEAASYREDLQPALKTAVDDVAATLSRMAASDDTLFDEASAAVDDRQLGTLKDFFKLLDDEGASLRLVEGERDFELDRAAVSRARGRVEGLSIQERNEERPGQIIGWAEYGGRFELRPHSGGAVLSGAVSAEAMSRAVREGLNPLHGHFVAKLKVREVRSRNRQPRLAYTLNGLEPVDPPTEWKRPSQLVV